MKVFTLLELVIVDELEHFKRDIMDLKYVHEAEVDISWWSRWSLLFLFFILLLMLI